MDEKKKQAAVLGGLVGAFLLIQVILDPFGIIRGSGGEVAPPTPAGGTAPDPNAVPAGMPTPPTDDSGAPGGTMGAGPAPDGSTGAPAPEATPQPTGPKESGPSQLPTRPDPMAPLNPPLSLVSAQQPWTGATIGGIPPLSYSGVMPRVISPPPPPVFAGTRPPVVESRELRLSGILLNGSLYVILEILPLDGNSLPRGYVVKPGDEVEGVRVVKIERYREKDELITRALVRTAGEERHVYLRPGPPPAAAGGAGGAGDGGAGMPGMPGDGSGGAMGS